MTDKRHASKSDLGTNSTTLPLDTPAPASLNGETPETLSPFNGERLRRSQDPAAMPISYG